MNPVRDSLLEPLTEPLANWAGSRTYGAAWIARPSTREEVTAAVREAAVRGLKARPLGTRHSFSAIADPGPGGVLLSTENLNRIVGLDGEGTDAVTVTVEAGCRYGELARFLHERGYALHNLASLPHISVAGAVATATHGSGTGNPCLAAAVRRVEVVRWDGPTHTLSPGIPDYSAAVIGASSPERAGTFGVVTCLQLAVEPTYEIAQTVYEGLTFATVERDFRALMDSAYSVSLFTDWRSEGGDGPRFSLWRKARLTDPDFDPARYGVTPAPKKRHPIPGIDADNCTEQGGIPGAWHERLPHFRMEYMPSAGEEVQAEYLIPLDAAVPALRAMALLGERLAPLLLTSEVRTIAADDLAWSPFYRRASVGLHFTFRRDVPAVCALLPHIEAALSSFDFRAHTGKLSSAA
jgi:alditol oxidase